MDDARCHDIRDPGAKGDHASRRRDEHGIAIRDAPSGRVVGVNLDARLRLQLSNAFFENLVELNHLTNQLHFIGQDETVQRRDCSR